MDDERRAASGSSGGESGGAAGPAGGLPEEAESAVGASIAAQLGAFTAPVEPAFYLPSLSGGPLRQAEILSGVREFHVTLESLENLEQAENDVIEHELAIILTQDCDLEHDFQRREGVVASGGAIDRLDDKLLPCVLLCEVAAWKTIDDAIRSQGSTIRERFRKNLLERYQYLRDVASGEDATRVGLGAMGVDFKRYFAIPTAELYAQLNTGCVRRCRLGAQYLEHFSNRFSYHFSRVALPRNHYN
jgi:hypothetical protein